MKIKKVQPYSRLPFHTVASLRERLGWFVNLRWIAVLGILICIQLSREMLDFELPYERLLVIAVILLTINIIYFIITRHVSFAKEYQELYFAELQIIIDLVIISFLVHYSGGITNPLYFLYIVHVILSGILFPGIILPYFNAVLAAFLLTFWSLAGQFNLLSVYLLREEPVSGSVLTVSLAAFYITDFAGIYIINNFMMGYRSLKKLIDEKNTMLEKSIKDRNKAYRYAAHELKAPVIAIQSNLAVIRSLYSGELKPEVRDIILRAENRSSQIIDMVKEMITITQYNLGMEKPVYETVNLNFWLETVLKQHAEYAQQKKISLNFIPSAKRISVVADINGMQKVVSNLLSNALRYTEENGTVILRSFADDNRYGFSVKDNGIGISEEDQNKIFDEFFRAKNAREMEHIGTGLGLNLVKEIVEYYNGSIKLKSKAGEGSEFIIEFPLSKNELVTETEDSLIYSFE